MNIDENNSLYDDPGQKARMIAHLKRMPPEAQAEFVMEIIEGLVAAALTKTPSKAERMRHAAFNAAHQRMKDTPEYKDILRKLDEGDPGIYAVLDKILNGAD